ncbi:MAG: hypothetical protein ABIG84_03190 [archaeon]
MIEAKALQRIRHAEIRAEKLIDECMKDSAKRIVAALRSCQNRIETEMQWAKKRAEKIVEHAKKLELEEKESKVCQCKKNTVALKRSSMPKKRAREYIRNKIFGVGDD